MNKFLTIFRKPNFLLYLFVVAGIAATIYLLFRLNIQTGQTVTDIKDTVLDVEQELEEERQLREERIINYTTCLLQTPLEERTDERVADCRESSGLERTPPPQPPISILQTNEDTERTSRTFVPSGLVSGPASSSSPQPSTPPARPQSENSQPSPPPPSSLPIEEPPVPAPAPEPNLTEQITNYINNLFQSILD